MPRLSRPLFPASVRTRMNPASRRGFTLVELLTVISIIAILAGILFPSITVAMISARKAKSTGNLGNIGHAMVLYSQDDNNKGLLPAPTYGQSNVPGSAPGSANPTQGTWLEELVPFLEGQVQHVAGSNTVTVSKWSDTLTDPEYLSDNGAVADPDKRGYGMNTKPYLADPNNKNRENTYPTQRQLYAKLPNHANNIIVATSNDVIIEPGNDGTFQGDSSNYPDGDPIRYHGYGLYLFLDQSVEALTPDQVQKVFEPPPASN